MGIIANHLLLARKNRRASYRIYT